MKTIFNSEFFPTPEAVIEDMLFGVDIQDKVFLEPSAGSGHIVEVLNERGAKQVLAFEELEDLRAILSSKCKVIGEDFLQCKPEQISHVHYIIMNPPFSNADRHILKAYEVAPEGCQIIALCNWETINNSFSRNRRQLEVLIKENGSSTNLGPVFSEAERTTGIDIGLIKLIKPVISDQTKFEGFYLDADEEFGGQDGLLPYDEVRDIVMRYIGSLKEFDEFVERANRLDAYIKPVGMGGQIGISLTHRKSTLDKEEFSKELQKKSWEWIIGKLKIKKFVTSKVMEDINKFVEQQTHIPFTQKNIYQMMDMIVQTRGQTMDKAVIEAFDKITGYHHDNRYNLPGFKTNKHYLVGEKFIFPDMVKVSYGGGIETGWSSENKMDDINKVLCYLTGKSWDSMLSYYNRIRTENCYLSVNGVTITDIIYNKVLNRSGNKYGSPTAFTEESAKEFADTYYPSKKYSLFKRPEWGKWCDWDFFEFKCYKKGTVHFKFKERDVWALFNQRVAKIKGFPLPEKL
ncbi:class I SAM-dependent methyltransferase [Leeuwenhoekiella sp. MAR_2009_132]|uniref:class I SAM-dependent methyltransferase n=1 Tax=Leeuwenhoekiella sp. MAR_2009_132 TaxID=1392489 RepID=UPI00048CC80C|nr:DUF4942 domain-containing protein [Leeuwenhoekiella sp. MAR_2009_132]